MSEDKGGRELTPREPDDIATSDSRVTSTEGDSRDVERFSAGPRAHSVGLTEERSAQIVRQSANARNVVFLAILLIALFIPVYWFYESGIPAVGAEGRLGAEAEVQYVTDVARGYELYIANCAECHGDNGQGGVGPPLNDQAKLYNAITPAGLPGSGHLNPDYIDNVLTVGGRYVCGDANSLMAAWQAPEGPLNYRQLEELIAWMTASQDVIFERHIESHGEADEESEEPEKVAGWRDPDWEPEPGATPPPACWKNPSGVIGGGAPAATPAPVDPSVTPEPIAGGSTDAPRQIFIEATSSIQFLDENGARLTDIEVVEGETVEFVVENSAGFDHNFYIGPAELVSQTNAETPVGIPTWQSGVETVTWTVEAGDAPLQFACTVPGHYTTMNGNIVIQG
jgi:mono/diheme cytochrome c family protein